MRKGLLLVVLGLALLAGCGGVSTATPSAATAVVKNLHLCAPGGDTDVHPCATTHLYLPSRYRDADQHA